MGPVYGEEGREEGARKAQADGGEHPDCRLHISELSGIMCRNKARKAFAEGICLPETMKSTKKFTDERKSSPPATSVQVWDQWQVYQQDALPVGAGDFPRRGSRAPPRICIDDGAGGRSPSPEGVVGGRLAK